MKKRVMVIASIICVIALCVIVASATSEDSLFYRIGETLRNYYTASDVDRGDISNVAATYRDRIITWAVVEHNRSTKMLYAEEGAQPLTDRQVVDSIIEGMMMVEEAERLGLAATQDEINSLVEGTKLNYEIAEVKELLDEYCAGAGITIEQYYDLVEENAPAIIAKQKLRNELGKMFYRENELEYANLNPPSEMLQYIEDYIDQLFEVNQDKITYYFDIES